jgi:hypothetical protein
MPASTMGHLLALPDPLVDFATYPYNVSYNAIKFHHTRLISMIQHFLIDAHLDLAWRNLRQSRDIPHLVNTIYTLETCGYREASGNATLPENWLCKL